MDGLAALVREELSADPYSGVIYVFRPKRADSVNLLFWDGTGVCLLAKRPEGGKFRWPRVEDGVMRLSPAQLSALDWSRGAHASCRPAHSDAMIHIFGRLHRGRQTFKSASVPPWRCRSTSSPTT